MTPRIGFIGLGVGERHLKACLAHESATPALLADLDAEKRACLARTYPDIPITADADEVIHDPVIDAVCIASFDDHHFAQTMAALDAGKHVFVEKPLCMTQDEARAIEARLAENPALRLTSNLILRQADRFRWLKQEIAASTFGRPYFVEADYIYGRVHKLIDGWRGRMPGYSMVLGGAVHMVDLVLWLMQERVTSVTAMGNRIATEGSGFANFDMVAALLRFESGVIAKVSVNGGAVQPHFHALRLYGTEATFVNGRRQGWLYRSREPGARPETIDAAYPATDKGALFADFIDAIGENREPAVTAREIFETMSVCFAIEKAAHTGEPVAVSYD